MAFKKVEVGRPELTVGRQPLVELRKRLRPDPVQAALRVAARLDQPRSLEDAEVLGDGRLAERKAIHELADRPLTVAEQVEDREAPWLGKDLERGEFSHGGEIA